MQSTPRSWGRVYWSGGAGKEGEMGGWRFHCNWCNIGATLTAFPRKGTADGALSVHVMVKHAHKTEVRALMEPIKHVEDVAVDTLRYAQSTTGAALAEAPLSRNFCSCGKQRPCFEHGLDFEEDCKPHESS